MLKNLRVNEKITSKWCVFNGKISKKCEVKNVNIHNDHLIMFFGVKKQMQFILKVVSIHKSIP